MFLAAETRANHEWGTWLRGVATMDGKSSEYMDVRPRKQVPRDGFAALQQQSYIK